MYNFQKNLFLNQELLIILFSREMLEETDHTITIISFSKYIYYLFLTFRHLLVLELLLTSKKLICVKITLTKLVKITYNLHKIIQSLL